MKKYLNLIIFFAGIVVVFYSCKKDNKFIAPYDGVDANAFLRVMHVSPNFRAVQNKPDSFNIYVGDDKFNSSLFTYNSAFPATTINTNTYAAVPAGDQQIRLSLQGVTTIDSLTIYSLQRNLEAGNYYTLFITDSLQLQQDAKKVWVNDVNFLPTDTGSFKIRFAHMVLNDTAGKKIDVYSFRQAANMFSGISPGTVTDFVTYKVTPGDTLYVRRAGTTQELTRYPGTTSSAPAAIAYVRERLYTFVYKGNPGSTSGTKGRSAIIYNNR